MEGRGGTVATAAVAAAAGAGLGLAVGVWLSSRRRPDGAGAAVVAPHSPEIVTGHRSSDSASASSRVAAAGGGGVDLPVTGGSGNDSARRERRRETPTGASSPEPETSRLLNLLYDIAADQALKDGFVHRGIVCNGCKETPIRGIRYKCVNCANYDVCANCEPSDQHAPSHVFLKIKVPIPLLSNPRLHPVAPFYPGFRVPPEQLSWSVLRKLQRETRFDQAELEALHLQYLSLSTADREGGGIEPHVFNRCLGSMAETNGQMAFRVFSFFDADADGVISFRDLVGALSVLWKGTQADKVNYAFRQLRQHPHSLRPPPSDTNKERHVVTEGSNGACDVGGEWVERSELRALFLAHFMLSMAMVQDVARALEHELVANFNDDSDKPVSAFFTAPIPDGAGGRGTVADGQADLKSAAAAARVKAELDALAHARLLPQSGEETGMSGNADFEIAALLEKMTGDAIDELVEQAFASCRGVDGDSMPIEAFKRWASTDPIMASWFESLSAVF